MNLFNRKTGGRPAGGGEKTTGASGTGAKDSRGDRQRE